LTGIHLRGRKFLGKRLGDKRAKQMVGELLM
jgi:hypothetical protein